MKLSTSCLDLDFVRTVVVDTIPNTSICRSKIHGFGLFASRSFTTNEEIFVLDGQVMSWDQHDKIDALLRGHVASLGEYFFMEWNSLDMDTLLVRPFSEVAGIEFFAEL